MSEKPRSTVFLIVLIAILLVGDATAVGTVRAAPAQPADTAIHRTK